MKKLLKRKKAHENTKKEFKAKHATTIENLKKAMKIKPSSTKCLKKKGAKAGHQGYARHIPERIDYVKPLNPKKCPDCDTRLTGKTQEIRSRHITDIKFTSKANSLLKLYIQDTTYTESIVQIVRRLSSQKFQMSCHMQD